MPFFTGPNSSNPVKVEKETPREKFAKLQLDKKGKKKFAKLKLDKIGKKKFAMLKLGLQNRTVSKVRVKKKVKDVKEALQSHHYFLGY